MDQTQLVLNDLQDRDDNIYRVIFEAEPIPDNVRNAGFGGVNRYKALEGFDNSRLLVHATEKLDKISKQMYIQSKSFDEVFKLVKNKSEMLASIPAIQPVSKKNLKMMAKVRQCTTKLSSVRVESYLHISTSLVFPAVLCRAVAFHILSHHIIIFHILSLSCAATRIDFDQSMQHY